MPDLTKKSMPPPPLTDWTDHGAFRAAFLERFQPEDRPVVQKAGAILASRVLSGDTHREPIVVSELEAAYRDAVMLADYLREIHHKGEDRLPTGRQHRLAERADGWAVEVASIALAIRSALGGDAAAEVAEAGSEPAVRLAEAARRLVRWHRVEHKLLRGSSPLVDEVEDALAAVEGEP